MRIGLVIEQFDPMRGGVEQWTAQLAAELLRRGHEVHVVARRFGSQTRGLPIIAHTVIAGRSRTVFARAAETMLRRLPLEVIHDMGAGWHCDVFQPHWGSWPAVTRQKLLLVPRWMRPLKRAVDRFLPRHRQIRRLLDRQYADDGRIVLALSDRVASDFQQLHGVRREAIRLIYNGVDTVRFSPERRSAFRAPVRKRLGLDDRTMVLLIVAHNFRLKGVPALLEATRRLRRRQTPVHLVVVGGKRIEPYARMARRLGAAPAVTFVGPVEDTAPYYAAADIYVQPTFYDTCSLVVLEALASGLPVVTSRFNGAAELLTEGEQGYVISDPADIDELLNRLGTLMAPDLRRRMGQAARELALKHTFDRNVDAVVEVYEEVVARKIRAVERGMFWARVQAEEDARAAPSLGPAKRFLAEVIDHEEPSHAHRPGD